MLRNWRATEQSKAGNIKDNTKLYSANIKHPREQKAASTAGTNARKRQKGLRQLSVKRKNASQVTDLGQGLGYKRSITSHEQFDPGSREV